MPGIIQDLKAKRITKFAMKGTTSVTPTVINVPQQKKIYYRYCEIEISTSRNSGNTNTFQLVCQATSENKGNGRYIGFKDKGALMAPMDDKHKYLVSGNFSGCVFKLFQTADGDIIGAHIARPKGEESEATVKRTADFAALNKWTEILAVPTRGMVDGRRVTDVFVIAERASTGVEGIALGCKMQYPVLIVITT